MSVFIPISYYFDYCSFVICLEVRNYEGFTFVLLFLSFLLFLFLLLFKYSCLHFPATTFPCPIQPHLPPSILSPIWLCPWDLRTCSLTVLPLPLLPFPSSPLVTVSVFFISMSLVMFCLLFCFVDQVPLKGEIIWYFSFTDCLISLSTMLSNSIHTVPKGISPFFLSASQNSIVYVYHTFLIHSFADGCLGASSTLLL